MKNEERFIKKLALSIYERLIGERGCFSPCLVLKSKEHNDDLIDDCGYIYIYISRELLPANFIESYEICQYSILIEEEWFDNTQFASRFIEFAFNNLYEMIYKEKAYPTKISHNMCIKNIIPCSDYIDIEYISNKNGEIDSGFYYKGIWYSEANFSKLDKKQEVGIWDAIYPFDDSKGMVIKIASDRLSVLVGMYV